MNFKQFKDQFQNEEVEEYAGKIPVKPVVSVCVQTFQHEFFIRKCLEGILKQQTNFPVEILLAEDGSKDKTRDICMDFASKYPEKIRLFLHSRPNNIQVLKEATANFPTLFNFFSAKGKYIAICEGDDYWTDPFKLQKQYSFMEKNPDFSVCYHDFKIINNNEEIQNSIVATSLKHDLQAHELLYPWIHPATLSIFFRNKFNDFPEEAARVINLDIFLYSLLGRSGKGKYLAEIEPAGYRIHSSGLWSSRTKEKKTLARMNTYEELANYYQRIFEPEIAKNFKRRNYKLYKSLIYATASSHQYIKTIEYFQKYLNYKLA